MPILKENQIYDFKNTMCCVIYRCKICGEILYEHNVKYIDAVESPANFCHKCDPGVIGDIDSNNLIGITEKIGYAIYGEARA